MIYFKINFNIFNFFILINLNWFHYIKTDVDSSGMPMSRSRFWPNTDEYGYEDINTKSESHANETVEARNNRFDDVSFENSLRKRDKFLKQEYTLQVQFSLTIRLIYIAQELAAYKWIRGLPVENKTEETIIMEQVEKRLNEILEAAANEPHLEKIHTTGKRLKTVFQDILEAMKVIQYSLISDWNANNFVDHLHIPRKLRILPKIKNEFARYQEITSVNLFLLAPFVSENYCWQLAGDLYPKQKKRSNFSQPLHRVGLARGLMTLCDKFIVHDKKDMELINCPPWEEIEKKYAKQVKERLDEIKRKGKI